MTRAGGDDERRKAPAVFVALERVQASAVADEARLIAARDRWNQLAGKVHDDEPLYEERAAAFLEWFALEHRGDDQGDDPPTAVERLIVEAEANGAAGGEPEVAALTALAASHRSLFRVRERQPGALLLDDLWGGGSFRARERRLLAGVERGEIIDARLVADVESPPELLLSRILCVHPREADDAIRNLVKKAKAAKEPRAALLFRLLRLRVRCERYQHVTPVRIYAAGETDGSATRRR